MSQRLTSLAAIVLALGVALGAFGAHGLNALFAGQPDLEGTYRTAVLYQLVHGLGLLGLGWASATWTQARLAPAAWLMGGGLLFFCGALYLLVLTGTGWLGAVAPVGGACFILAWLWFAAAVWRAGPSIPKPPTRFEETM